MNAHFDLFHQFDPLVYERSQIPLRRRSVPFSFLNGEEPVPGLQEVVTPSSSVEPKPSVAQFRIDGFDSSGNRVRRVVWKFGGTSVGDPNRLRAIAKRLVTARREGIQIVAVLSAMGGLTDDLLRFAHEMSPDPQPRELDALLSVGESMSCALVAIAVHELGERAVSLTGSQAGILTNESHGNARIQRIIADRIIEVLDRGLIALVTGFQGVSSKGDVTTLGRGGSDTSAIALALALGVRECDIFTDVSGVFTADPRVVPDAHQLASISHEDMVHLADAGARVLQTRAVELAAAHNIDVHVRSSTTFEPGTWVRGGSSMFDENRVVGVAYIRHDPVYTVVDVPPAAVSAALAERGVLIGSITGDDNKVRFTAPEADSGQVIAALATVHAEVTAHNELGSVSVVCTIVTDRSKIVFTILSTLKEKGIDPQLVTHTSNRVSCHVLTADIDRTARALHRAFQLHRSSQISATDNFARPSHLTRFETIEGESHVA